jgi:hypothetical protein
MKKSILNIGKKLDKAEQQAINGGHHVCDYFHPEYCQDDTDCYEPWGNPLVPWYCIQSCCVAG